MSPSHVRCIELDYDSLVSQNTSNALLMMSIGLIVYHLSMSLAYAADGQKLLPKPLIPADGKSWTIELTGASYGAERAHDTVTIDSSGLLTEKHLPLGNDKVSQTTVQTVKLSLDETTQIFSGIRDLFNSFGIEKGRYQGPRGDGSHYIHYISIRGHGLSSIRMRFDPYLLRSPALFHPVNRVFKVLDKRLTKRLFILPSEVGRIPAAPKVTERVPENENDWSLRFCEGTEVASDDLRFNTSKRPELSIGQQTILYRKSFDQFVEIPATQTDLQVRRSIMQRFLNQFEIGNAPDPSTNSPQEYFTFSVWTGMEVQFTMDYAFLKESALMDDLNDWINNINNRFKATGSSERFVPPWNQQH